MKPTEAIDKMSSALSELRVHGITTQRVVHFLHNFLTEWWSIPTLEGS
jgi:pyruvate carboxylase